MTGETRRPARRPSAGVYNGLAFASSSEGTRSAGLGGVGGRPRGVGSGLSVWYLAFGHGLCVFVSERPPGVLITLFRAEYCTGLY